MFISREISSIPFFDRVQSKYTNGQTNFNLFIDFVIELYEEFNLSLRDITTLFQTYRMIEHTFLDEYVQLAAHKIYFLLLLLKYKDNVSFRLIMSGRMFSDDYDEAEKIIKRKLRRFDILASRLVDILTGKNIGKGWYIATSETEESSSFSFLIKYAQVVSPNGKNPESIKIAYYFNDTEGQKRQQEENVTPDFGLNGVLFFPDLKKWDQIKDLTLAQYYHRQLEMFDFVLPADEAKTEP